MVSNEKRKWVVHFQDNTISELMTKRAAEKYLHGRGDADYMVKVSGKEKGKKVYNIQGTQAVFCEVFVGKRLRKSVMT